MKHKSKIKKVSCQHHHDDKVELKVKKEGNNLGLCAKKKAKAKVRYEKVRMRGLFLLYLLHHIVPEPS